VLTKKDYYYRFASKNGFRLLKLEHVFLKMVGRYVVYGFFAIPWPFSLTRLYWYIKSVLSQFAVTIEVYQGYKMRY